MSDDYIPYEIGPDLIHELAVNEYPSPLNAFREAVSNGSDAIEELIEKLQKPVEKRIDVTVKSDRLVCEDWGFGITDARKFISAGNYAKTLQSKNMIGAKGLGRLALLRFGPNAEVVSNNGRFGMKFSYTPLGVKPAEYGKADEFLSHQGTQITILEPVGLPQLNEIDSYLEKVFALRIIEGLKINFQNKLITTKFDGTNYLICKLKHDLEVRGNITSGKKPRVGCLDIFVRKVWIKSLLIDVERDFVGWVNSDDLTPQTNRNDLVEDDAVYRDFVSHLKDYVVKRFPKRQEDTDEDSIKIIQQMSDLLESYLKELGISITALKLAGRGSTNSEDKQTVPPIDRKENNPSPVEHHPHNSTNKQIKRKEQTSFGLDVSHQELGNDEEPIFFLPASTLVWNTTNDLFQFAQEPSNTKIGAKWFRLIPYLARVAVSINPQTRNLMDVKERNKAVDAATRFFLKSHGLI